MRDCYRRTLVLRKVIIVMTTGTTFRGVIYEKRGPLYILRSAELLEEGVAPTNLDGEIVIEADRIDYIQIIGVP
jgi:hypothetical protein